MSSLAVNTRSPVTLYREVYTLNVENDESFYPLALQVHPAHKPIETYRYPDVSSILQLHIGVGRKKVRGLQVFPLLLEQRGVGPRETQAISPPPPAIPTSVP